MKNITENQLKQAVFDAAYKMCFKLDEKVLSALKKAQERESGELCRFALSDICENARIAENEHIPLCQDTGIVIAFAQIGNDVHIEGDFEKAINDGIAKAYKEAFLRKSVVKSPINRENSGDNSPAVIYTKIVKGDKLKITLCPKGAGSENMSKVKMLKPADGIDGIKKFVLETVKEAGGKACPPLIVGVGIGGTMDKCALLSKTALIRPFDDENADSQVALLEKELLNSINNLKIGAMGLKGDTTCIAVKIDVYPCHIASLPVAVTLMCHAVRHGEVEL